MGPAVALGLRRMGCARVLRERAMPGVRQSGDLKCFAHKHGVFFLLRKMLNFESLYYITSI
jgi:hypothetical protein